MLTQTPLTTYLLLLIVTYVGSIASFLATFYAPEELKIIEQHVKRLKTSALIVSIGAFLIITKFSLLSLLAAVTTLFFLTIGKRMNITQKGISPVLAVVLFGSLANQTLLTIEAISIFAYFFFTTTLALTPEEKNKQWTKKPMELLWKAATNTASYLLFGLLIYFFNI